ncbi:MAG: efflux RND transporter periplasmic adaptor subunit, partial [Deltaproteobacteria bacterium]|nr:efflux RND transporter periplasmic adaptor subunit [Deltaproteobacteria bacterium]
MPMIRRLWLLAGLLPLLALACGGDEASSKSQQPASRPPTAVELLTLKPTEVRESVQYLGSLASRESVDVRPQTAGYVRAIHVHPGDHVDEGDALIDIDARQETAALASAKARVAAARAELAQARRNETRVRALEREGLAPAEELERARADVALAEASAREAEAAVSQREVLLQYAVVKAPSAGVIGEVDVRVGDAVTQGQTLTTLTQSDELEVSVWVPSDRASTIAVGQTLVEILGPEGAVLLESRVFYVAPRADPRTQLVEVKARVDNTAGLREQELVPVRIVYSKRMTLQVPALAVTRQSGQAYVYAVEEEDGGLVAHKRPVTLGPLRRGGYELISGMESGARMAVSSIQSLRDGAAVVAEAGGGAGAGAGAETGTEAGAGAETGT